MKKIYFTIVLLLMVAVDISQAQLATDSWAFGFGFGYPRYIGVQVTPTHSNYGGYLSLKRNFSEHFGLRFKGGFSHMEGTWVNLASATITESTNLISGDLDFMYYLIPCEPVSPYVYGGVGGTYRMLTNKATATLDDNATGAEWNFGFGVEWALDRDWKIVTEFGYHSTSNSELDGFYSPNGNDSYWGVNVGLLYLFAQGGPSKLCQLYPGITPETKDLTLNDLNKIEEMIVKHIPKEITKEVVVEKPMKAMMTEKWILIGVNFDFDKSTLLPESYPILYDAAKTLLRNPDIKVEIQGYCDYIGSVEYNNKLSLRRAETVKMFLVSKGIAANRLTTVGFGKSNPVADNNTANGRAMNRRIEFKVQ
ncbi:MAG: OmpA family protein [Ignavibacteriales bacterium]|nr:OmpA family protein [Ignavibacteriales bacterium]